MRVVVACGVAAACLLLPACATITRGTSQKFNIESTPSEAEVALSTGQQCVTPCKLKLKRKPGFKATFKKQGYKTQEVEVESKLSGGGAAAGAGNIIAGGVIGGLVDGSNGSLNSLTPNPLQVTLVPEMEAPATAATPEAAPVAQPVAEAAPAEAAPIEAVPAEQIAPAETPAPSTGE